MSEKLKALHEMAKRFPISAEVREAQRISFAYGNLGIEDESVTREDIMRASAKMKEAADGPSQPPEPSPA